MSLSECAALTVTRSRAFPFGTVGYRIAGTKISCSYNFCDNSTAADAAMQKGSGQWLKDLKKDGSGNQ